MLVSLVWIALFFWLVFASRPVLVGAWGVMVGLVYFALVLSVSRQTQMFFPAAVPALALGFALGGAWVARRVLEPFPKPVQAEPTQ
jgi:hypothetical protein